MRTASLWLTATSRICWLAALRRSCLHRQHHSGGRRSHAEERQGGLGCFCLFPSRSDDPSSCILSSSGAGIGQLHLAALDSIRLQLWNEHIPLALVCIRGQSIPRPPRCCHKLAANFSHRWCHFRKGTTEPPQQATYAIVLERALWHEQQQQRDKALASFPIAGELEPLALQLLKRMMRPQGDPS